MPKTKLNTHARRSPRTLKAVNRTTPTKTMAEMRVNTPQSRSSATIRPIAGRTVRTPRTGLVRRTPSQMNKVKSILTRVLMIPVPRRTLSIGASSGRSGRASAARIQGRASAPRRNGRLASRPAMKPRTGRAATNGSASAPRIRGSASAPRRSGSRAIVARARPARNAGMALRAPSANATGMRPALSAASASAPRRSGTRTAFARARPARNAGMALARAPSTNATGMRPALSAASASGTT